MNYEDRKHKLLAYLQIYNSISNQEAQAIASAHRNTITNDFDRLLKAGIVQKTGTGKGTRYILSGNMVFPEIMLKELWASREQTALERYFRKDIRKPVFFVKTFEQALLADFSFSERIEGAYHKSLEPIVSKREMLSEAQRVKLKERMVIDLAWASSQIEGNTYTLLDTETLIKYQQTAHGKSFDEATMILNHKRAIEYLRTVHGIKILTKMKALELHQLLIEGLGVPTGFRKRLVKITNSSFVPCDNEFQIASGFDQILALINHLPSVLSKAVAANLLIALLQPFEDGNKRSSRMLGNALLLGGNYLPVSFSHTPKDEYIKSILYFYEKQDPRFFKRLFLRELNHSFVEYVG